MQYELVVPHQSLSTTRIVLIYQALMMEGQEHRQMTQLVF